MLGFQDGHRAQNIPQLILGALLLYSSAYAFGVDEGLRSTLQSAMVALTLTGIGLVWKGWLPWAAGALAAVASIFGLISNHFSTARFHRCVCQRLDIVSNAKGAQFWNEQKTARFKTELI